MRANLKWLEGLCALVIGAVMLPQAGIAAFPERPITMVVTASGRRLDRRADAAA